MTFSNPSPSDPNNQGLGDQQAGCPPADSAGDPPHSGGESTVSAAALAAAGPRPVVRPSMDPLLTSIQPGGGVVMSLELAWGYVRRWYLRTFKGDYVRRMEQSRQGVRGSLPFEPVDQRDLKFYRNQETYWWPESDDDFRWREALPFARAGLAELLLLGGLFLVLTVVLAAVWWPLFLPPLVVCGLIIWFFRDPSRSIPSAPGTIVSPADGKIVEITQIDDPDIGQAVRIGIFLSIFNVHINRASLPGTVVAVRYRPGKFLNALRPESAQENENLDVILSLQELPGYHCRIRQITGQFARRIVCWVRPGDVLRRGEQYGMIKLGSRTELVLPLHESMQITTQLGAVVQAGTTQLAQYRLESTPEQASAFPTPSGENRHG